MNLAILRLYLGESGKKGFYNMQELGLAKAFSKYDMKIYVFLLEYNHHKIYEERIDKRVSILHIPCLRFFNHGIFNCRVFLKYHIDIVQILSDNQLFAPNVMHFCRRHNIKFYNYIGTLHSIGSNRWKKKLMNLLSNRNIRFFKKSITIAKTPSVQDMLIKNGVLHALMTPVGLDVSVIPQITKKKSDIRKDIGLPIDKKVIIFVGRLEHYKKPLEAIKLIEALDDSYFLIIVGKGSLKNELYKRASKNSNKIKFIHMIPNKIIHYYYKAADYLVNFNDSEIFGMGILEAMYQNCIVVAQHAPGPDYIIENNVSGILVNSTDDMIKRLKNGITVQDGAPRKRIENNFLWDNTASFIYKNVIDSF